MSGTSCSMPLGWRSQNRVPISSAMFRAAGAKARTSVVAASQQGDVSTSEVGSFQGKRLPRTALWARVRSLGCLRPSGASRRGVSFESERLEATMLRLAARCLLGMTIVFALPAHAARRVAIIIDQSAASVATSAGADATVLVAASLAATFGFDVIRSAGKTGPDLARDLEDFRGRIVGSEIALLYFAGRVEHDRNGTFLLPGAESGGASGTGISLDDVFGYMVDHSRAGLALLEAFAQQTTSGQRYPGFGRMPTIPDKLLISLATPLMSQGATAAASLAAAVSSHLERQPIRPLGLIVAARDQLYLESAGLQVLRTFGSLPAGLELGLTSDRMGVPNQI